MHVIYVPLGAAMLVFAAALVQHLGTVYMKGPRFVMTDRSQPLGNDGFAGRSKRALQNTLESTAMMVPLALVVVFTGTQNNASAIAGVTYLIARIVFLISYWTGVNLLRSAAWAVGMISIIVMAATALASV